MQFFRSPLIADVIGLIVALADKASKSANNVFVGDQTINGITVGRGAGTDSGANTALGINANYSNTTGSYVTGVGANANLSNTTGSYVTGVGANANRSNTTGSNVTGIGVNANRYKQDGTACTDLSNITGVGANTRCSANNQVQLGDSNTTTYVYGTVQNRSDLRDKTDVRDTLLGLDFINALRPVDYRWDMRDDYLVIEDYIIPAVLDEHGEILEPERINTRLVQHTKDGSKKRDRYHHGLIAQEVAELIKATSIDFGGYQDHSKRGGTDVLSIGYDELIAPLIKAVQELSAQVHALENNIK